MPGALGDLSGFAPDLRSRVFGQIAATRTNFSGDVRRVTHITAEYRLRVGYCRVLFELEGLRVIMYRVRHRREAYR